MPLTFGGYVVTVITHFQTLTSSKQPRDNKSYDVLVQFHEDDTILKFQFFKDIGNILSAYLKQFQTDKPVMLVVIDALEQTCRPLMTMFLRRSVVDEACIPQQLIKVDVETKENCLPYDSIKLPTATKALILSSKVGGLKKLKLKENCVMLLKSLILKMQERSPLNYLMVRCLSCFVPKHIGNEKDAAILKFNKIVDKLFMNKHLMLKTLMMQKCNSKIFFLTLEDNTVTTPSICYFIVKMNYMQSICTTTTNLNRFGKYVFLHLLYPMHRLK